MFILLFSCPYQNTLTYLGVAFISSKIIELDLGKHQAFVIFVLLLLILQHSSVTNR